VLFATSVVQAEQGRVVLVGGQVLEGDIEQVVNGDYVIIKLANGELKGIPWADIDSFTFASASTPPPPPVYAAPPPAVWYGPPPPPPPRRLRRFEPSWNLGVRVGTMAVGGNVYGHDHDYYDHDHPSGPQLRMSDVASWGWMVEGDVGYHFSPSWTVYALWEHGELDHGDLNSGSGRWGQTNAVGFGINANTAPYDTIGLYVDMGAAYRWMSFSDPILTQGTTTYGRSSAEGFDYLRIAFGMSINVAGDFRLDPHFYVSSGYFTRFHGSICGSGCSAYDGQGVEAGFHTLSGFAVSGHWDL